MWKPIVSCFAIATVVLGGAGVLQAQLVQVEPGYVRAPFVRVYTGPGGTYVRAPFVAVQGGLRQVYAPPSPEELAQLDARGLRQVIRDLSQYLDEQLSSLSTGNTWRAYLKTAEIRALASADTRDATPTADSVKMSRQILKAFDATRNNPEYRKIASLDGFQGLYDALVEFSADPELRARRQLVAASEGLNRALDQFSDSGWRKHLALPADVQAEEGTPPNREELARLLARYDAVSRNPEYRAVANLPAFQAVHERLANYVNQSAGSLPPAPGAEELPIPKASSR